MGKKIYGKKHRGVKDPQQQRQAREDLVKNKINCKPADIDDDQPIPESLHNLIKLKKLADDQDLMKKRKKRSARSLVDSRLMTDTEETLRGMSVPEAPIPAFIQQPGESKSKFLQRVDRICDRVVIESGYTNKHKNDLDTNPASDEDEDAPKPKRMKRERGNIEDLMRTDDRKMKQKKVREGELTQKEKLKARTLNKKKAKQNKVEEKMQERNRFRDNVAFGEIVHAPPVLKIPARNQAKKPIETKPGKRSLLLNHILHPDKISTSTKLAKTDGTKKTKAKSLPAEERERIEKNRIIAVEAYRRLKLSKGK